MRVAYTGLYATCEGVYATRELVFATCERVGVAIVGVGDPPTEVFAMRTRSFATWLGVAVARIRSAAVATPLGVA